MEIDTLQMEEDGSIVLSKATYRAARIQPNEELFVSVEDDAILIQTRAQKDQALAQADAARG